MKSILISFREDNLLLLQVKPGADSKGFMWLLRGAMELLWVIAFIEMEKNPFSE